MEATHVEATPEEAEAAVVRQELFKEEIIVDNIGSLEDRYGDRRLAVRRRRGPKKRIQDSVRSRHKSSAAGKRAIRPTVPVVRKGHMHRSPGRDSIARGAPKGRRLQKTPRFGPECKIGIWGCNLRL
jgi:hypothetical protein